MLRTGFETAPQVRGLLTPSGIGINFKGLFPFALRSRLLRRRVGGVSKGRFGRNRQPLEKGADRGGILRLAPKSSLRFPVDNPPFRGYPPRRNSVVEG